MSEIACFRQLKAQHKMIYSDILNNAMRRASCFLLLSLTAVLYGQQTTTVAVILSSKNHESISLRVDDLKVELNNQTVMVVSVSPLANQHLQYVLLNDQSQDTRWPGGIKQQTDAAAQFLKQVVTPGTDVGSLVNFATEVYIDVQNSRNPDEITAKLVRSGYGKTRMYDAVLSSARWLAKQPVGSDQRKVLFLFCDGEDNGSATSSERVIKTLQQVRIPIFVVAPTTVERKKDGRSLRQLAEGSGGQIYFLPGDAKKGDFDFIRHDLEQSFGHAECSFPPACDSAPCYSRRREPTSFHYCSFSGNSSVRISCRVASA